MAIVRTLCGQCAVGCGVRAVTGEGRSLSYEGDPVHPASGGLLCPQSDALTAMAPLDGRLLHPMLDGQRISWQRAIGHAARRLKDVLGRHGPDSVAMHVAGTLLTEDYYVANKLMKGFVGSAHIDGPCWRDGGMAIEDGRIRLLWLLGGLPPVGHPLRAALAKAPFVILSTPSLQPGLPLEGMLALPSPVWIEKDGTITGADRLISRQRRLFPLPGEARPDWWSLTQVARSMGWHDAFHYERPAEIYREHARLTAYRNEGERLLNLRRHAPISNPAYDELTPWRWGELPFDGGHFLTPDGKARLLF